MVQEAVDVSEGRAWLLERVDLLPGLQVVVAFGNRGQDAISPEADRLRARGIAVLSAPHPSQRVYNANGRTAKDRVHAAFAEARRLASTATT